MSARFSVRGLPLLEWESTTWTRRRDDSLPGGDGGWAAAPARSGCRAGSAAPGTGWCGGPLLPGCWCPGLGQQSRTGRATP